MEQGGHTSLSWSHMRCTKDEDSEKVTKKSCYLWESYCDHEQKDLYEYAAGRDCWQQRSLRKDLQETTGHLPVDV
jgi:hypothetical protein